MKSVGLQLASTELIVLSRNVKRTGHIEPQQSRSYFTTSLTFQFAMPETRLTEEEQHIILKHRGQLLAAYQRDLFSLKRINNEQRKTILHLTQRNKELECSLRGEQNQSFVDIVSIGSSAKELQEKLVKANDLIQTQNKLIQELRTQLSYQPVRRTLVYDSGEETEIDDTPIKHEL